jgi:hypothetical protein
MQDWRRSRGATQRCGLPRGRPGRRFTSCAHATEVEWPSGPCLVYLYNPFAEPVMVAVVEAMRRRLGDRRDELEIVYQKPERAASLEKDFEMVWGGVCAIGGQDLGPGGRSARRDQGLSVEDGLG